MQQSAGVGRMLYCPKCRDGFDAVVGKCIDCGEALVNSYFTTRCPECGAGNRVDRTVCWKCSNSLVVDVAPAKPQGPKPGRSVVKRMTPGLVPLEFVDPDVPPPAADLPPVPVFPPRDPSAVKPARRRRVSTRKRRTTGSSSFTESGMSDWDKVELGLGVACSILDLLMLLSSD